MDLSFEPSGQQPTCQRAGLWSLLAIISDLTGNPAHNQAVCGPARSSPTNPLVGFGTTRLEPAHLSFHQHGALVASRSLVVRLVQESGSSTMTTKTTSEVILPHRSSSSLYPTTPFQSLGQSVLEAFCGRYCRCLPTRYRRVEDPVSKLLLTSRVRSLTSPMLGMVIHLLTQSTVPLTQPS